MSKTVILRVISLIMGHMGIEDVDGFMMGRSVVETDIKPPSLGNTRRENNRPMIIIAYLHKILLVYK